MSLYATEKLPQPHLARGVVENDPASRTLSVRLSDHETGYGRLLWRQAFQALAAEEESGAAPGCVG
jgi:hypothetical protein